VGVVRLDDDLGSGRAGTPPVLVRRTAALKSRERQSVLCIL
jgi:hypothetical protein